MRSIDDAVKLHQEGKVAEAEAIYDEILARRPDDPNALHLKGVALMQRGDARGAIQHISKAIVAKPSDALFYVNLAASLQMAGLDDRAIEYANRALALDPRRYEANLVLGRSLMTKRAYEPALDAFMSAFGLQPRDGQAALGVIDNLQALNRLDEAVQFIDSLEHVRGDEIKLRHGRLLRLLKRYDAALEVFGSCELRDGHDWHVAMLKLRLDRGEPAEAISHGKAVLDHKDRLARGRLKAHDIDSVRSHWSHLAPGFRPNDSVAPERNVVCFSLWGDNPKYTFNAVLNAKHVPHFYPGWSARFYVDSSVPPEIVQALVDYGARVIAVEPDKRDYLKLFWRFLASDDPKVERFICRDCDAVVNMREASAVGEWIESGKRFHVMRDHPEHAELMMAGMWGGIAGLIPNLTHRAVEYYETHESKWRWVDQDFLRDCIWPVIREDCLVHDDIYRMGVYCRPFPAGTTLPKGQHVGGYTPRFAAEKGAARTTV
jgi:tetratricopeptide (TPR) repeat protein